MTEMVKFVDVAVNAIDEIAHRFADKGPVPLSVKNGEFHTETELAVRSFEAMEAARGLSSLSIMSRINSGYEFIRKAYPLTESPIEKNLLPWLVFGDYGRHLSSPAAVYTNDEEPLPAHPVVIVPQFEIGPYRLDFAVIARSCGRCKIVAAECDGQEFHQDRLKDQKRDAILAEAGIQTVRASGADIHQNASRVASTIVTPIIEWARTL